MNLSISKKKLFDTIQQVSGVIEKRQTLPILSNMLIDLDGQKLRTVGTDMELEVQSFTDIECNEKISFTVGARKIIDIIKFLDDDSVIQIAIEGERIHLHTTKSNFYLSALSPDQFPLIEPTASQLTFKIKESSLKNLIRFTGFAMAQQDVRYYLNGLLFEVSSNSLRTVATDGHRLAISDEEKENQSIESIGQVIIPRKTILELNRLLTFSDTNIGIEISSNHVRFYLPSITLTSKLIDGRYPDYLRVIPSELTKSICINRLQLRSALQRVSILSNEKYKGVQFSFSENQLLLTAHNPEHESAEEIIDIEYRYENLSIGFNVLYVLDILNTVETDDIIFNLHDENISALIHSEMDESTKYVIMPMRL